MLIGQFIINGLIAGAVISLVAVSFSLIYATNRFVHFAHGAVLAGGAYMLFTASQLWGLPLPLAMMIGTVGAGILGLLVYYIAYKPLKKRGASSAILLIASLAVMIFLENLYTAIFGSSVQTIEPLFTRASFTIGNAIITPVQVLLIATSLFLFLVVWIFVRYTTLGKKMKAVTDNPDLASITGINVERIHVFGFFMGSCIAGLAGVLIAFDQNVFPLMGTNLIIKGFAGAVVGGIYSLPGALLGSYLLGMTEHLGVIFISSAYREAIVFIVLVLFLLFRPQGILGLDKGVRK